MSSEGNVERTRFYIQAYDDKSFLVDKFFHVPSGGWVNNRDFCTWFPSRSAAVAYWNEYGLNKISEIRVFVPGKS
jgi:hypothetical protein